MNRNDEKILLVIVAIIVLLLLGGFFSIKMKNRIVEGVVVEKFTKIVNGHDKYLIVVEHNGKNEVMESTDSFLNLKYNSADIYANVTPGNRYRFEVVGFRSGFLSANRNIVLVKQIE